MAHKAWENAALYGVSGHTKSTQVNAIVSALEAELVMHSISNKQSTSDGHKQIFHKSAHASRE